MEGDVNLLSGLCFSLRAIRRPIELPRENGEREENHHRVSPSETKVVHLTLGIPKWDDRRSSLQGVLERPCNFYHSIFGLRSVLLIVTEFIKLPLCFNVTRAFVAYNLERYFQKHHFYCYTYYYSSIFVSKFCIINREELLKSISNICNLQIRTVHCYRSILCFDVLWQEGALETLSVLY